MHVQSQPVFLVQSSNPAGVVSDTHLPLQRDIFQPMQY